MALPTYEGHRPGHIVVIILSCVALAFTILMTVFYVSPSADPGIYVREKIVVIDVSPAVEAFYIYGFIHVYQIIFLVYSLTTICRKTSAGYLYATPPLLPPFIFVIYIICLACNVGWLFTTDHQVNQYGLFVLALETVTLWICLGISMNRLHRYASDFIAEGKKTELKLIIGLVHNAFGVFAAWTTLATMLYIAFVLSRFIPEPIPQKIASSICLVLLALALTVYTVVEHLFFEKHFRHLYTPYISLLVGITGILIENWNPQSSNSIFTLGLLVTGVLLAIFKIARSIYMEKTKPLFAKYEEQIPS